MGKFQVASVRVKINSKGARALLTSDEVADDLQARAERIAAAAGGTDEGYVAEKTGGPARARSIVITTSYSAQAHEARDRTLTRSIDAGRG